MAKPIFPNFLLAGLFLLAAGCAGSARQADVPPPSAAREEFDPQTLDDDDFLIQPPAGQAARPGPGGAPAPRLSGPFREADGYRVQVAAVLDRSRAEALRAEAEKKLRALAYVYYDEGTRLYKVQVGNCETPADAERLREAIKAQAYREAFVVRARIQVPAVSPR